MWVVCLGHLKNFSRERHGGPPGTAERLHGIWSSLGMGQGRCIGGSGPHNLQPAAKGSATWERWWMSRVGAHGDSTRQWSKKVKSDPRKRCRSSLDFLHRDCNLLLFGPQPKIKPLFSRGQAAEQRALLSLLAGVLAPGWNGTKNSTDNTWQRFGF